jgi:hypothetical protein
LIAPCATESRVISRITDSVNDDALRDARIFDIPPMIVVDARPFGGSSRTTSTPGGSYAISLAVMS